MLSSVGESSNNVQRFSAVNALRSNSRVSMPEKDSENSIAEQTESGTKAAPKSLLERVDVADIRKYAETVGEFDITDDEIKYGLMYGRSVIAEWLC